MAFLAKGLNNHCQHLHNYLQSGQGEYIVSSPEGEHTPFKLVLTRASATIETFTAWDIILRVTGVQALIRVSIPPWEPIIGTINTWDVSPKVKRVWAHPRASASPRDYHSHTISTSNISTIHIIAALYLKGTTTLAIGILPHWVLPHNLVVIMILLKLNFQSTTQAKVPIHFSDLSSDPVYPRHTCPKQIQWYTLWISFIHP